MAHDHSHHGHHHHHSSTGNIKVAFFLNLSFTIVEIIGGIMTNSVAILSDALHDFGDSLSLGTAWYFQSYSKKGRDKDYSYGYKRFSLLGAIINSVVLIVGSIFILKEAIPRLLSPETPDAGGMILLAVLGVIVNGAAVLRLRKGTSLNEEVVSLHLLEDVLGWVAVLIGSIIMYFFELPIIDPILSVLIAGFILINVFRGLKKTTAILLQGIPQNADSKGIKDFLSNFKNIIEYHDLHIWSMDGEYNVMTVHLVVRDDLPSANFAEMKKEIRHELHHLGIEHATIEFEKESEKCAFADC